jgi:excinuclease ABC subunit A
MSNEYIHIKGARVHNLKNVELKIKHGSLTVITGLSGSGKSSLAFDTLYAEGQRRYIESLSSYARQFLGKLDKPDVDYIKGIAPAIAIEQKVISSNARSTVGTTTEIYDFLKILYARVGKTYSPVSGREVKKHTVKDVVDFIFQFSESSKLMLLAPIDFTKYGQQKQLDLFKKQGYSRLLHNNTVMEIEDALNSKAKLADDAFLIIDRIVTANSDEALQSRIAESTQLAFSEGNGKMAVYQVDKPSIHHFSSLFELDGITFLEPNVHFFTFNNPFGACKMCEGYGSVIGIDESLVIPDKNLSVYQQAIAPWKGQTMGEWLNFFIAKAAKYNFPIHKPIQDLTEEQLDLLWNGKGELEGIRSFFAYVESKSYKIQYRVLLSRYRGKTVCPECQGTRLRKETNNVKIGGKTLRELVLLSMDKVHDFFTQLKLEKHDENVAKRIFPEIQNRLLFLKQVGLGYLTLNRASNTLSGGEAQRINLATSLGSSLVGSMYILDEPSIGLHPKDTALLVNVLQNLKNLGNTVIVVEHEEEIMRAADEIVDMGPEAGINGGEVVFQGSLKALEKNGKGLTAAYLNNQMRIELPKKRRKSNASIQLLGAKENNLKNIDVRFPLNNLVCITGVSGSGKTTLVKKLLFPCVKNHLGETSEKPGNVNGLVGDLKLIQQVELIDQNPIGKSSRSNPVTYLKAFDEIRQLFASQKLAKQRNYKPGFFSFNVPGGRCDFCEGEGQITISMQFMADVHLNCEHCKGKRYKPETLDILCREKSIADILEMSIEEALTFFKKGTSSFDKKIMEKISPLAEVGLGYVKLGQSSSSLSGGEAQRVKLASFLSKGNEKQKILFIFDEPTTGLHFHDISKLMIAFNELIALGHSIIVIEHNGEVIKMADHIIDLGPQGGENGGSIVFQGTPEEIIHCSESATGRFLRSKLIQ